jgi:hypothetical protein
MARHARFLWLLFSSWALLAATNARAQTVPSLDLQWRAPASCPQQRGVRERIEKLAGSKKSNQAKFSADGTITQSDDGRYHLKLVVREGGLVGQRSIESKSCEQLAGAAAVALGLLVQSGKSLSSDTFRDLATNTGNNTGTNGATSGEGASNAAGDTNRAASAGPQTDAAQQPPAGDRAQAGSDAAVAAGTDSRRRVRARLQVPMVALGVGPLPLPSFGLAVSAGASVDDWSFFVQLTKWAQQHLTVPGFPAYGADVDRATVNLGGCRAFRRDVFEVAPCLVMSVEHLSATGMGDRVLARSQRVTWFAPGLGGQARVYLADWFALGAAVTGQVETSRAQISIAGTGAGSGAGVGQVGRLGPAAVTVLVGSEWIL